MMPPHPRSGQGLTAVLLPARKALGNGGVGLQRKSFLWKDPQHGGFFTVEPSRLRDGH